MNFMNGIKNELDNAKILTENGAVAFKTSGHALLDLNFAASSLRNKNDYEIQNMFQNAFFEDQVRAMEFLFFLRDVRGGMGERRSFRICMNWLIKNKINYAVAVLDQIAEYGRWDDVVVCLGVSKQFDNAIVELLKNQLMADMKNLAAGQPISLLAKWMPSENTSSFATKAMARKLIQAFNVTSKDYRKLLSALRKQLNIVETQMCDQKWNEIDYSIITSGANLKYGDAFLRHDEVRRRAFFDSLNKGETKINASTLFPSDIVSRYGSCGYWHSLSSYNDNLEALWKALPDYVKGEGNTICVADGSGSMTSRVSSNSQVTCLDVAHALAIYFAEHSTGAYKDKYISFSENPQLVDFSRASSLHDKLQIARSHSECENTNIEAVFDLVLDVAVKNHLAQSEIPNILILSDMEFDSCAVGNRTATGTRFSYGYGYGYGNGYGCNRVNDTLFQTIAKKYAVYGYQLPKLTFWNICSRTGAIPVKENELGVALVSGFSPAIMDMVLSTELDPYKNLIKKLDSERYAPIAAKVKDLR